MSNKIKLYKCRAYLFCLYELLEINSVQIAEECGVCGITIRRWLRKFDIRIRTKSEQIGKNASNYGKHFSEEHKKNISNSKSNENNPNWKKDNNIKYCAIHNRAHKVDPKPADGKCAICHKVKDKKGITKLIHSNKEHSYNLPIVPDEWQWIHENCHKEYDLPTTWSSKRRKEQAERWKENSPMKRPEIVEKMLKTRKKNKEIKSKIKKNKNQLSYWFKIKIKKEI